MMAGAFLIFDDQHLRFDVVTSETAEFSAEATEHPVEQGANITDHVRRNLDTISLEVMVSNSPLRDVNGLYSADPKSVVALDIPKAERKIVPTPGGLFTAVAAAVSNLISGETEYKASVLKFGTKFDAIKDTMEQLLEWRDDAVLGSVVTPWRTFENMIITKVSPVRNAEGGNGAKISIEFKEIRIVESKLVSAPKATEVRAKPAVEKGAQNPKPVEDKSVALSVLDRVLPPGGIKGLLGN